MNGDAGDLRVHLAARARARTSVVASHGAFVRQVQPHSSDFRLVHDIGRQDLHSDGLAAAEKLRSGGCASSAFRASRAG